MIDKKIILKQIASTCLLCNDAACDKACPEKFKPSAFLRSARFDNEARAARHIDKNVCQNCKAPCQEACIHFQGKLRIKNAIECADEKPCCSPKPSLEINFLGVRCENPFFLSSSVVASNYEMCARALEMGWGGIVYKTIGFYVPEEVSPRFSAIKKDGTPFVGFKNLEQISEHTPEENFAILAKLKKNYPTKVIVASIMGQTEEEWTKLAEMAEEAGCDIIECNFSCPQMTVKKMGSAVGADIDLVEVFTKATRKGTKLPILAKMTPNITDMVPPAFSSIKGGANGIAAINTIKCITNVNLETMQGDPNVSGKTSVSGYSGKAVKPIALRFVSDLASSEELKGIPLSGIGGIETWHDAMEFMALGCRNIQITTSVMQYGYRIIDDLIDGTETYMAEHGISSLDEIVGKGIPNIVSPICLDRQTVVYPLFDSQKCIACQRCFISCRDGGHQAISIVKGKPKMNAQKCVGCLLCSLVCPVEAITASRRVPKPHQK